MHLLHQFTDINDAFRFILKHSKLFIYMLMTLEGNLNVLLFTHLACFDQLNIDPLVKLDDYLLDTPDSIFAVPMKLNDVRKAL